MISRRLRRRWLAFTLVEMLVVIGIIAIMGSFLFPAVSSMIRRAQSAKCAANLQSIGIAVMHAASDNNNTYPEIDQAALPIYPPNSGATNLVGALAPYGIVTNTVQCPTDLQQNPSSFTQYGSSYEWSPIYDDSVTTSALVTINGIISIPLNSPKVRLCTDFLPIHGHNKVNALYGDGHVVTR
jgi:prepilin-type processing-associated H-X9-DG protein